MNQGKKCFEHPNKKRFSTQKDAEAALLTSNFKNLRYYHCETCDGWHLTSKIKKNNFS